MDKNMNTDLRQHYHNLAVQDTPFIERFGTKEQKEAWNKGKLTIQTTCSKKTLLQTGNLMGGIKNDIHRKHQDDTEYRLFYLQHGPQSYEDIKKQFGAEIADTIKSLREQKEKND